MVKNNIELTDGILKSVDSAFHQFKTTNNINFWVCKYKGELMADFGKIIHYKSENAAKKYVIEFIRQIFWQGEYWQSCSKNIKKNTGYDVDYSATIKILPQYGLTERFNYPENKQMFKDIAFELIKQKIIIIEEIKL